MYSHSIFKLVFTILIESCALNYCQDGIQVYFGTETQQYTYVPIYGHYELQPGVVNGRPYFKMGIYGLWFSGIEHWWIGRDRDKGQSYGYANYIKDVFCPHQLMQGLWKLFNGKSFYKAGEDLYLTCKWYIFILYTYELDCNDK